MHLPSIYRVLLPAILASATSCTSLNITNYYHRHRYTLDGMEQVYQKAYQTRRFSIEFTDRAFDHV